MTEYDDIYVVRCLILQNTLRRVAKEEPVSVLTSAALLQVSLSGR